MDKTGLCSISDMAVPCVFLLTVLGAEVTSKSTDSLESDAECCVDAMEANSTCLSNSQCTPGCYRRWNEDGSSSCVKCENETLPAAPAYNLTDCQNDAAGELNSLINITTLTPETLGVGGPEVAASLIFGTFVISLFLILCVAFFFYLKRANKLPNLFYRRSKGSIVQSAESASMLSPPSSIRKPRYVRRDRSLASSTTSTTLSAETRVSNV
ncbi:uncharacterized protein C1orf159 homolog isoform X2 [Pseudonaja textilis]|uniref:uncharacterized protein C1orf159 homolog isoform X2 n=1 Tax=Pseudonaja textilis TaxID=8673 RepID=UPI000EA89289|nr:uncharacterized protein C1orf159 homolog isoform X2 [Pseudonaja textilis]